jgi:maltose O-acetyltransferase
MTEKERMLSGELYKAEGEELVKDNKKARKLTRLFNNTTEEQQEYRVKLLKQLFASTEENIYIEPPFRCDYGCHITVGNNFYANYDCIILDVNKVDIGSNVFFAPRVNIYTAGHPIDAEVRNDMLEFGKEVITEVEIKDISVGSMLQVNTGDKIPVDGEIISGEALIDESMITGESIPVEKFNANKVISGTILVNGNIRIRTEAIGKDTVLSKIIELVKKAQ